MVQHYPISHLQRRLWVLWHKGEEDVSYNSNTSIELTGPLHLRWVEKAFATIIQRHESLRTTFVEVDDEPRQRITETVPEGFSVEYVDLRATRPDRQTLHGYINRSFNHKFDLENGPLIKVKVLQLEDTRFILLCSMHHIISDGWSLQNISREFGILYNRFEEGLTNPFPAIRFHHKDFVQRYFDNVQEGGIRNSRLFWLDQMKGALPILELPTDRPRPPVRTYVGDTFWITVDQHKTALLDTFSRDHNLSLFVVLLAALKALLYKYTGQTDIILGLPEASRTELEMEPVVGCFVNTLALRTHIDPERGFLSLAREIKANLLDCLEHKAYPFDDLVTELKVDRDNGRSPVYDVSVNYIERLVDEAKVLLKRVALRAYDTEYVKCRFDLEWSLIRTGNDMRICIVYNTGLFDRWRIEQLMGHYTGLLDTLTTHSFIPLEEVSLASPEDIRVITQVFNGPGPQVPDTSVIRLFREKVRARPGAIAIRCRDLNITYTQLDAWSDTLSLYLVESLGVTPGSAVGIWMEHSEWVLVCMLAAMKAGAAFVPLNTAYADGRLFELLSIEDIRFVCTDREDLRDTEGGSTRFVTVGQMKDIRRHVESAPLPEPEDDPDRISYIIFTSGSTGNPKGVEVSEKSLLNYLLWTNRYYYAGQSGYPTALFTSLSSDLTITTLFAPLLRGDGIHIFKGSIDEVLHQCFDPENGIRTLKMTPSHISLLEDAGIGSTTVDILIAGGEELLDKHMEILTGINASMAVYNEYGPTEATVGCIVERVTGERTPKSIGRPIDNCYVCIMNDALQLQPAGVLGEIFLGGTCLARGYKNNNALTHEKFIPNPWDTSWAPRLYKTGDLGRWLPNGVIEFYGRRDGQVKIKGYRVELGEIVSVLESYPGVQKAAVLLKEEEGAAGIAAYIVGLAMDDWAALKTFTSLRLPAYMCPRWYFSIPRIPLASSGKIDTRQLPAIGPSLQPVSGGQVPGNAVEQHIMDLWKKVLGGQAVGVEDNFFEVGGDSIGIIRLHKALVARYGKVISVVDLFRYNTIRAQGHILEHASENAPTVTTATATEV